MDDVLMQGLQTLKGPTGVFELDADLTQFRGEQAGQVGNSEECKQVDENDCLERLESWMRGAERPDHSVVVQLQHTAIKNECESGNQASPDSGQEDAGNDNDQRIKEIERTVPATSLVDDKSNEGDVSEHLQCGLQPVLLPKGEQEHVKERQAVPEQDG